MAVQGKTFLIIGGGIGGLTAALALRARGAEVRVLEQAPQIQEVGAGLQISPNGMRVLDALGQGGMLRACSLAGQAVSLRDYARGREVLKLDLTHLAPGQGYYFVHRADLVGVLERAARHAGVTLQLGARVQRVESTHAQVTLSDGTQINSDVVLGADGLHSVLRPGLGAQSEPFFTGQVAWRAVVPNVMDHPPQAVVHMGKGRHMVTYPLRGGESVNVVAVLERSDWTAEGWTQFGPSSDLQQAFAGFGGVAQSVLAQLPDEVGLWGLFRHPVATQWTGPAHALLGDAAHPTLPFLAQGANMALEDAWALAACLDKHQDLTQGLARYQTLRRPRVVRVIEAANGNARNYHLRHPLLRQVAHLGLGVLGRIAPGAMLGRFDWLYGYDVTRQV